MGSVTAFANPQRAKSEVSKIKGIINFFGTTGIVFDAFIFIVLNFT